MSLIRPPALAASTVLNKAAFARTFNIAAASVRDNKRLSHIRLALTKSAELLSIERHPSIMPDPDATLAAQGRKCMLLNPEVLVAKPETWGPVLSELVKQDDVGIVPYALHLGYDYWSYRDVLMTLLPEELHDDIPSGFNTAGHVAHLNLRDQHLPYKMMLAEVLVDKNLHIRTVINKTSDVGTDDQFRTFPYELLAGPDDLKVKLIENGCKFEFDYSKVYWNSRLEKEHTRITSLFKSGEAVCDVMAGIGPFAVPAGKKGVFVWANDYNPESYKYLTDAIRSNKVRLSPESFQKFLLTPGRSRNSSSPSTQMVASLSNKPPIPSLLPLKPARKSSFRPSRPRNNPPARQRNSNPSPSRPTSSCHQPSRTSS